MMLASKRRQASLHGWAISVLLEEGVIRQCTEHGWMRERGDPHARLRALDLARADPPTGYSSEQAVAELLEVLDSVGDECPECPSNRSPVSRRCRRGLRHRSLNCIGTIEAVGSLTLADTPSE